MSGAPWTPPIDDEMAYIDSHRERRRRSPRTRLTKPITRVVDFGRGPVAVTLRPDGLIAFREKRRRVEFYLPIGAAFIQAVARAVAAEKAAKKAARKAARS